MSFLLSSSGGAGASLLPEPTRLAERNGRNWTNNYHFPLERRAMYRRVRLNRTMALTFPENETKHYVADDR